MDCVHWVLLDQCRLLAYHLLCGFQSNKYNQQIVMLKITEVYSRVTDSLVLTDQYIGIKTDRYITSLYFIPSEYIALLISWYYALPFLKPIHEGSKTGKALSSTTWGFH
jgi:hypothetical protein